VKLTIPSSKILAMEQRPSEKVPSTGFSLGSSDDVEFQSPAMMVCTSRRQAMPRRTASARATLAP
jgi:hypothetical protein